MGSISHCIMLLVINSLGGRNTHAYTRTHAQTHTQICIPTLLDKAILRNQAHASLWPVRTWLKACRFLGNSDFYISKFHMPKALFCSNINAVLQKAYELQGYIAIGVEKQYISFVCNPTAI